MRLYSVQPKFVYDQLNGGIPFQARPKLQADHWLNDEDDHFRRAYGWLCHQMELRGLARPADDVYPVWAWYQWAGPARSKPDLRTSSLQSWAKSERHVLLTLELPYNEVLLHDFDAWHFCLNYWYLGSQREKNKFVQSCAAKGLSHYRTQPLPDKELDKALTSTWQRIFDLSDVRRIIGSKIANQSIQATFWQLRQEHVIEAVEFGAGEPKQSLLIRG